MKRSRSSGSCQTIEGSVLKCQRTMDEVTGAAGRATKEVGVKEKDHVMEVVEKKEPTSSLKPGAQVIGLTKDVQEALHLTSSFHNADF